MDVKGEVPPEVILATRGASALRAQLEQPVISQVALVRGRTEVRRGGSVCLPTLLIATENRLGFEPQIP